MRFDVALVIVMSCLLCLGCHEKTKPSTTGDEAKVPATSPSQLLDTKWELTEVYGKPVIPAETDRAAFIQFSSQDQRAVGMATINRFFGQFTLEGDKLKLDPLGMTRMAGPEPLMKQEDAFVKALSATKSYRIAGNTLELLDGDMVIAKFAKR